MYRQRYRRIVFFFARQLFTLIIWDILFPHIGFRKYSQQTRPKRLGKIARAYRLLAIQMGGVLIKVGQFLSTRVDVLPPEFTNELINLQDEVPAEEYSDIRRVAEEAYGTDLSNKFVVFDPFPLAAASLGQVHRAKIFKPNHKQEIDKDIDSSYFKYDDLAGETIIVVVKIQRPNIETIIKTDLSALATIGNWLQKYKPIRKRADIPALLDEFKRTLYEEIDYINEGKNAETFAENFKYEPQVRVPKVIWSHTTKRTLTLENVWGIKITDYADIKNSGVNLSDVASHLIDTYLKQIFEDGFFHADPHPGNLFINPIPIIPPISRKGGFRSPKSNIFWQLTFVDFGMVGRIPDELRDGLREMLIGIATKNPSRVIKSYQILNIILPGADIDELEKAGAAIFDLFWGMNMKELSQIDANEVIKLTKEYRHLIYSLPIQIPQNLLFLGRTVGILTGICTGLDPEFNLFDHIAPYAQKFIIEEAKVEPTKLLRDFSILANTLITLPGEIDKTIKKIDRGEIEVRMPEVSRDIHRLEKSVRQVVWGIIFASMLFGGIQLQIAEENTLASILFIGALFSFLIILFTGRRI